jgi:hypothetical protein
VDAGRGRRCRSGAGAGAVVAARPGAPRGRGEFGRRGEGRAGRAAGPSGRGGAGRVPEQRGIGRRRRRWEGAALREDRGTALREDRPGLRGFRDLGFQLGRLGRLFFSNLRDWVGLCQKKVQLVADPRFFAERPKMRTRHIKLC